MYFGGEDPIGRRIRLAAEGDRGKPSAWLSIVGVFPAIRQRNVLEADPDPVVYLPYRAEPVASYTLLIKSSTDPARLTSVLRESVRELDADLPLFDVQTLEARLAQVRWNWEIFAKMSGIFAGRICRMRPSVGNRHTTSPDGANSHRGCPGATAGVGFSYDDRGRNLRSSAPLTKARVEEIPELVRRIRCRGVGPTV